jgi:hypothetical protein
MAGSFVPDILCHRDEKYQRLRDCSSFSLLLLVIHGIQRTFEFCGFLLNQVKIDNGCFKGGVAKEIFDGVKICSLGKEVGGKAVPEAVKTPASFYTGFFFALIK